MRVRVFPFHYQYFDFLLPYIVNLAGHSVLVTSLTLVFVAVNWLDIHSRIRNMIKSAFEAAAAVHPEMHHSKSRAMYGVDVMLDSHFQPKLLEV